MKRLGIDANILLRALLNDDPKQSALARDLLAGLDENSTGYLGIPALLEIFWVLRSRYRVPREAIHDTMRGLLMIRYLEVESSESVAKALSMYQKGRAEFEDALLGERNVEAGCDFTYTFDRDASSAIHSMQLLSEAS